MNDTRQDLIFETLPWFYIRVVIDRLRLIVLGVAGILPPATSALLHNASTLAISLQSMTNLLEET